MKIISKANAKQIAWAAVGVTAGLALFNNLSRLTSNTIIGRVLNGSLVRSA